MPAASGDPWSAAIAASGDAAAGGDSKAGGDPMSGSDRMSGGSGPAAHISARMVRALALLGRVGFPNPIRRPELSE